MGALRCLRNKPQAMRALALCTFPLFDKHWQTKLSSTNCEKSIEAILAILTMPSYPLFLFLSFVSWKHDMSTPKRPPLFVSMLEDSRSAPANFRVSTRPNPEKIHVWFLLAPQCPLPWVPAFRSPL